MSFLMKRNKLLQNDERPLGLKLIVFLSVGLTIIAFLEFYFNFGTKIITQSNVELSVIMSFILTFVYATSLLIILYYLYNLNQTAYVVFTVLTGITLLITVSNLNVIGVFIQGSILTYLLIIKDVFE